MRVGGSCKHRVRVREEARTRLTLVSDRSSVAVEALRHTLSQALCGEGHSPSITYHTLMEHT